MSNESKYYIGYAIDDDTRWKASSGGIGTAIQRYLLSSGTFGTSLTFAFNKDKCQYEPKMVYSARDINICGSIYHDIDVLTFIRENFDQIKNGIVVTCSPCQVQGIRRFLCDNGADCFVISYCCSGQMSVEGTWKYLNFLGIVKEDIDLIQYRGNGWPSGIQIKLKDGRLITKDNYTEPWVTVKVSRLFQPRRCFYCKLDTGRNADIALSDPWLLEYKSKETVGQTLFLTNTVLGDRIVREMLDESVVYVSVIGYEAYAIAQKYNIEKKVFVERYKTGIDKVITLNKCNIYRRWAISSLARMRIHNKIICKLMRL